jgi:hypothetical protein
MDNSGTQLFANIIGWDLMRVLEEECINNLILLYFLLYLH